MGLHFLAFWPCGPSFPFILAFSGSASGPPPPTSCQKWPVCPTSLQWIYQRRDRPHFAVFSILGLHFLAFWPCGPSFPCILALWAFISLHFGLHFLAFWPCGSELVGPPHKLPKTVRFPNVPYKEFSSARPGFIFQFLAFWAFISFHFGLLGLHFLAFWPFRPSFPFILAFWAFILHFRLLVASLWAPPHKLPKTVRFPNVPYKEFSSGRPGSIFQFLAFWAFISFHFGLLGLHFLSFWPFGPSFLFILAFWAFFSFHFGILGLHFLSFCFWWLASGAPPTSCQKRSVFPRSHTKNLTAPGRPQFSDFWHFWPCVPFILVFLALFSFSFWPFGPSFPFILSFLGLHFLSFCPFWPCLPFILAFLAFISFHFCLLVASFWGPPHKLPKTVRFPKVPHKEFNSARPSSIFRFLAFLALFSFHFGFFGLVFLLFWPFGPSFSFILAFWEFISFHFGLFGFVFLLFWPFGPSIPFTLAFWWRGQNWPEKCPGAWGVRRPIL